MECRCVFADGAGREKTTAPPPIKYPGIKQSRQLRRLVIYCGWKAIIERFHFLWSASMQKKEKFNFHRICLEHHYGRRFIVLGLWTPIWPPWRNIANGHHPRETYNTRHKSLKQTPFVLNFLEHFLHSLFALLFSLKCAPFLPQCWATRILEHWDDCNTQINIGKGETRTSVSGFLTSIEVSSVPWGDKNQ